MTPHTRNVKNADFAEDGAVPQRHEDGLPVVGHDVELAALDDVHLLADVAFPANVVARRKDL
jgi:hypothetical protein